MSVHVVVGYFLLIWVDMCIIICIDCLIGCIIHLGIIDEFIHD
jgi:hypothetical protein